MNQFVLGSVLIGLTTIVLFMWKIFLEPLGLVSLVFLAIPISTGIFASILLVKWEKSHNRK